MMRSVLAVIAGIVTLTVTSFAIEAAADPILMHVFPHALPNRAAIGQNLASAFFLVTYTSVCVAAGGYVTAWIARRSPIWHAVAMGHRAGSTDRVGHVLASRRSAAAELDRDPRPDRSYGLLRRAAARETRQEK